MSYFNAFKKYFEDRVTVASGGVAVDNVKDIYDKYIDPFLVTGEFEPNLRGQERKKFIGEVFALWLYSKKNRVDNWKHAPSVNGKTPDFSINDEKIFVEVYSPTLNHGNSDWQYYTQTYRRSLAREVQAKSSKYKSLKLVIIVNVVVNEFADDFTKTLKRVQLSNKDHRIYFYHGDKESIIPTKVKS